MASENRQLGTRVSPELYEKLRRLAKEEHTSVNRLVEQALRELLRKYTQRRRT